MLIHPDPELDWCGFAWQFHAREDTLAIGTPMYRSPASIAGGILWIENVSN